MTMGATKGKEIQGEIDVLKSCRSPQIVSYFGTALSGADLWVSKLKRFMLKYSDPNGTLCLRFR